MRRRGASAQGGWADLLLSSPWGGVRLTPAACWVQSKVAAWVSLFACLGSLANSKTADMDIRQMGMTLMFSVMTVVMNYVQQPRPKA